MIFRMLLETHSDRPSIPRLRLYKDFDTPQDLAEAAADLIRGGLPSEGECNSMAYNGKEEGWLCPDFNDGCHNRADVTLSIHVSHNEGEKIEMAFFDEFFGSATVITNQEYWLHQDDAAYAGILKDQILTHCGDNQE